MRRWELAAYGRQHLSQVRVPRAVLVSSSKSKLQRVKAVNLPGWPFPTKH